MPSSELQVVEEDIDQRVSEPLSKRVVKGGLWIFALRALNRGFGFLRTIVLARLLAPQDFGLLGVALVAIGALEAFSQTGFYAALIQKKDNIEGYLDTAWTVSAIRGLLMFLVLFASAPLIARFFDSEQVILVIRVFSISILLAGFINIGIVFFQKDMEFDKQFIYETSGTLVDVIVAISLAFMLQNVWALVWGGLAANFVRFVVSYLLHPYRPRFSLEKEKFQELFSFGKWLLGSSVLIYLITQGDNIVVGKLLGVTYLGLYGIAYRVSNMPATEIAKTISQVTFPENVEIQDDKVQMTKGFLRALQSSLIIGVPFAIIVFVLAEPLTIVVLGDKWRPIIPALKVLSIAGVMRCATSTMGPVFLAVGKPYLTTVGQVIRFVMLAVSIFPFTVHWGIVGTSLSVVLCALASLLFFGRMVGRILNVTISAYTKAILPSLAGGIALMLLLTYLQTHLGFAQAVLLILSVSLGSVAYLGAIALCEIAWNCGCLETVRNVISVWR